MFVPVFISDFFLCVCVMCLSGFAIITMWTSLNEFGSVSSSSVWSSLRRMDFRSSLNLWYAPPELPSGPGHVFAGRFLMSVSVSMLIVVCSYFSILPDSVLGECTFLEICPFSHCPFYWCMIVVITYDPLCFGDIAFFFS